jgi:hypothetical protein
LLAAALYIGHPCWSIQNILMVAAVLISIAALVVPPRHRNGNPRSQNRREVFVSSEPSPLDHTVLALAIVRDDLI